METYTPKTIQPGDTHSVTTTNETGMILSQKLFTACVQWTKKMADPLADIQYAMKAFQAWFGEPAEIVMSESDAELAVTREPSKIRLQGIIYNSPREAIEAYTGLRVALGGTSGRPLMMDAALKFQLVMHV